MSIRAKKLQKIYESMKVELLEKTVNSLVISEEKKYINYAPSYQRNYIWSEIKASNLIETVLMNGIVPPLIALKKGKQITIIDGRQRYETLLKFYNNEFKLNDSGLQKLKDWGCRNHENLAPNLRTLFKEYKIKIICYTVQNSMIVSDEDLEYLGRDLFRRHNFGTSPLKNNDIERAKYSYDGLTRKFEQLLKTENELYNKCIELFSIGAKKHLEERDKMNLLLITIRELLATLYIPIVGEKNIQFSRRIIDTYYDKFITKLTDKEKKEKINEFKKIFEKLCLIKENLKETNTNLQNDIQFLKSVYWMLSICYHTFSNEFYDFNIDKFCHHVVDGGEDYFETYNRITGYDTEKRMHYMKNYMEKELKLDINSYLEKIKGNKKSIIYKKDSNINKDKVWNSPFLAQQLRTRKETMEISEIIRLIKENRFMVRPNYQRGEVVNRTKASRVIESIILGVKLPPIYLYTDIPENGLSTDIVLDGQQRLIDILQYIGEPITNEDYQYIKTGKEKYALQGLRDLEDLNSKVYAEDSDKASIGQFRRKPIEDYVFDIIRIDKKSNENVDFVDIFIRLNQNPCPINMNTFEMWNSFDVTNTINKIKELAKHKAFKQPNNTMKEEELITILAYMHYEEIDMDNINEFFRIHLRTDNRDTKREKSLIKISVRYKEAITNFLEKMIPDSKEEKEFINSINAVKDFMDKLKLLSNNDEKLLMNVLNPNNPKSTKVDKNCFYIMWLILQELDTHIIRTYREELLKDLKELFKLMQNMPKNKKEKDFLDYVNNVISKYRK